VSAFAWRVERGGQHLVLENCGALPEQSAGALLPLCRAPSSTNSPVATRSIKSGNGLIDQAPRIAPGKRACFDESLKDQIAARCNRLR
jgi:hypothetical protein